MQPHNEEIEQYLLSACIQSYDCLDVAYELVTPEDFYLEQHAHLFDVLCHFKTEEKPVTVPALLQYYGDSEKMCQYIEIVRDCCPLPMAETAKNYINIIRDCSARRKALDIYGTPRVQAKH